MRYGKLLWNDLMVKRPISDTNGPSDAEDMLCIGDVQLPYRVGLSDWLAGLVHAFEAAGIRTAKVDARLLLAHALGLTNNQFDANSTRLVTTEEGARVKDMAQRRLAREPLSRIIGVRKFYGRSFDLAPAILDPRRDTELLISAVLNIVKAEGWENAPLEILDLGTGSGCILLSLLSELKLALGLGVDLSTEALDCAKHNAAKLGVAERCRFQIANWLQGVSGSFQIVVANPPYMTGRGHRSAATRDWRPAPRRPAWLLWSVA